MALDLFQSLVNEDTSSLSAPSTVELPPVPVAEPLPTTTTTVTVTADSKYYLQPERPVPPPRAEIDFSSIRPVTIGGHPGAAVDFKIGGAVPISLGVGLTSGGAVVGLTVPLGPGALAACYAAAKVALPVTLVVGGLTWGTIKVIEVIIKSAEKKQFKHCDYFTQRDKTQYDQNHDRLNDTFEHLLRTPIDKIDVAKIKKEIITPAFANIDGVIRQLSTRLKHARKHKHQTIIDAVKPMLDQVWSNKEKFATAFSLIEEEVKAHQSNPAPSPTPEQPEIPAEPAKEEPSKASAPVQPNKYMKLSVDGGHIVAALNRMIQLHIPRISPHNRNLRHRFMGILSDAYAIAPSQVNRLALVPYAACRGEMGMLFDSAKTCFSKEMLRKRKILTVVFTRPRNLSASKAVDFYSLMLSLTSSLTRKFMPQRYRRFQISLSRMEMGVICARMVVASLKLVKYVAKSPDKVVGGTLSLALTVHQVAEVGLWPMINSIRGEGSAPEDPEIYDAVDAVLIVALAPIIAINPLIYLGYGFYRIYKSNSGYYTEVAINAIMDKINSSKDGITQKSDESFANLEKLIPDSAPNKDDYLVLAQAKRFMFNYRIKRLAKNLSEADKLKISADMVKKIKEQILASTVICDKKIGKFKYNVLDVIDATLARLSVLAADPLKFENFECDFKIVKAEVDTLLSSEEFDAKERHKLLLSSLNSLQHSAKCTVFNYKIAEGYKNLSQAANIDDFLRIRKEILDHTFIDKEGRVGKVGQYRFPILDVINSLFIRLQLLLSCDEIGSAEFETNFAIVEAKINTITNEEHRTELLGILRKIKTPSVAPADLHLAPKVYFGPPRPPRPYMFGSDVPLPALVRASKPAVAPDLWVAPVVNPDGTFTPTMSASQAAAEIMRRIAASPSFASP